MADSESLQCGVHGAEPGALICRHLREGRGLSFYATPRCSHGPAQAWCTDCDEIVEADQGWSDRADAFAAFVLVCSQCHRNQLRHHTFLQFSQGTGDDCDWSSEPPPNR